MAVKDSDIMHKSDEQFCAWEGVMNDADCIDEVHMLIKPSLVQIVDKHGKRVSMRNVSDSQIQEMSEAFSEMLRFLKKQAGYH